ncbi:MAG TPA: DNA-deoxyinosine glycosylase [Sphingomicrobium sp.]|nr:DNA-deoxyinosine glycosylase [Sphingomicrobium sp.]
MRSASIKVGLPPVAPASARLFILGSLPGDVSLGARQYYAHPTNQFWRLLGGVLGEELHGLSYEERLARLAECGVGLWDVIASAERRGSLDQAIRVAEHNAIEQLLHDFPDVRAIAFNGATAAKAGRRLIGQPPAGVALIDLPSSSAANTMRLDDKAAAWVRLAPFVAG